MQSSSKPLIYLASASPRRSALLAQIGVPHQVRPVDVMISGWECVLEAAEGPQPAVRLGMNVLRGMREEAALRIETARAVQPFSSNSDLARRAGLDRFDMQLLAGANALAALAGHRRQALWQAVAAVPDKDLLRGASVELDTVVQLAS